MENVNNKISLFDNCLAVFQGGGCKAIAYIGAYKSAFENGVHFNELAGTSAGAIISALIAAGATPSDLEDFILKVDFKSLFKISFGYKILSVISATLLLPILVFFLLITLRCKYIKTLFSINYWSIYMKLGMFNIKPLQNLIEVELQRLTRLKRVVTFNDLIPDLHVVASNYITHQEKVWNKTNTPNASVAEAVCASCAIPVYFQPVAGQYVDGGLLSNAPSHIFANRPNYNRILCFQNISKNSIVKSKIKFSTYIKELISTIVDGAVSLQNSFGMKVNPIEIAVGDISAIDFDKISKNKINELVCLGAKAMESFIAKLNESDTDDNSVNILNNTIKSYEQVYSLVSTFSKKKLSEIYIACSNTKWVWVLFATVLRWVSYKAKIVVYISNSYNPDKKSEKLFKKQEKERVKFLKNIGCMVIEDKNISLHGFFLKESIEKKGKKHASPWTAVFFTEKNNSKGETIFEEGAYYDHKLDSKAIEAWVEKLKHNKEKRTWEKLNELTLEVLPDQTIYNILQKYSIYSQANFRYESIRIDNLNFLHYYTRLEKYRQTDFLLNLYKENNVPIFKAAKLKLMNGQAHILAPIIIERMSGNLYVVEGNTRLMYAYYNGYKEVEALIVDNVETELPIEKDFRVCKVYELVITDSKRAINEKCQNNYRHIERHVHSYDEQINEIY